MSAPQPTRQIGTGAAARSSGPVCGHAKSVLGKDCKPEVYRTARNAPDGRSRALSTADARLSALSTAGLLPRLTTRSGDHAVDMHGGDMHGGDMHGGDKHGGDKHGGDKHGGDKHGGDKHGGDKHGGDKHGGDKHGGDKHGGDKPRIEKHRIDSHRIERHRIDSRSLVRWRVLRARSWLTRFAGTLAVVGLLVVACPAGASADARLPSPSGWPLAGGIRVVRGFDPPAQRWGAGHRGVDLAARPGDPVLAAAAGRVTFARSLAGRGVVVVDHGAMRTTYEPVAAVVAVGDRITTGAVLGRLTGGGALPGRYLPALGSDRGPRHLPRPDAARRQPGHPAPAGRRDGA